jgi:fructose-specific PTS system IIA-like component
MPSYLSLAKQAASLRGAQLYGRLQDTVRTQLRALLRAAVWGNARILVPMVSCSADLLAIRKLVNEISSELETFKVPFSNKVPVGAMIESTAASTAIPEISPTADFFSIGTNDLTESLLQKGREETNGVGLKKLPELLHSIRKIASDAHASGKDVTVCGELAADIQNLPLIIGAGIDGVSLSSHAVAEIKRGVSKLNASCCCDVVAALIDGKQCSDKDVNSGNAPLICAELVNLESTSTSQHDAIRELANLIFAASRTDDPETLEAALWAREAEHSTGFGHGFAIPHCKTAAIAHSSIAVLKLKQPIEWSSIDGEPVRIILLLAINPNRAAQHMPVLSALARNLMKEEFRDEILSAQDSAELLARFGKVVSVDSAVNA